MTVWRRSADAWAYHEEKWIAATIDLPEIDAALPLAELYEGLEFTPPPG